jgi:hypothetical protein
MLRALQRLAQIVPVFLLYAQPCLAHEESAELGHHWLVPAYACETRLQICVIIGCLALLYGIKMIAARLRRRSV